MSAEQIDVRLFVFVTEVAKDYAQVSFDVPVRDYVIKLVDIPLALRIVGISSRVKWLYSTIGSAPFIRPRYVLDILYGIKIMILYKIPNAKCCRTEKQNDRNILCKFQMQSAA
jgi:hypothetical protein